MAANSQTTDISLHAGSAFCKLLGIACPPVTALDAIVDAYKQHRSEKQYERLRRLVNAVETRLSHVETQLSVSDEPDLFDEIIEKAVTDEDGDKIEYYAALIEYTVRGEHPPYEIRMLGSALKQLTRVDIQAFVQFSERQSIPRDDLPKYLEDTFWNRLETLGLFKGGSVKHPNNISVLGNSLVSICQGCNS